VRGQAGTFEFGRVWLATALIGLANGAWAAPITYTVVQNTPVTATNFNTLSDAANHESPGNSYLINISPGTYLNDFPVFQAGTTTDIEGIAPTNSSVILQQSGVTNDQGIIETFGALTVNNLTIDGATASAGNSAAGVRDHQENGGSLTVTNSVIENSQNGIQTSTALGNTHLEVVTLSGDTFINDGGPNGPAHAAYIGDALTASIINSTFCGTNVGHDIKSRAPTTTVTASTMYVGAVDPGILACANNPGSTSAGVDLPNGGVGVIQNDMIIQGTANSNGALLIYGGESPFVAGSLDIAGSLFQGDGASTSVGINQLGSCAVPVTGVATFQNLGTDIKAPAQACTPETPAVPEPASGWLLLTALGGGAGWLAAARRRSGRAIKG